MESTKKWKSTRRTSAPVAARLPVVIEHIALIRRRRQNHMGNDQSYQDTDAASQKTMLGHTAGAGTARYKEILTAQTATRSLCVASETRSTLFSIIRM